MSNHFRIEVKTLSKSAGQSAASASAYDKRERHQDKSDLSQVGSLNMPSWASAGVGKFWAAADEFERANGMVARRAILSFPNALPMPNREKIIREWLSLNVPNCPASWAIHDSPDSDPANPHCHILVSERQQDGIERPPELFFKRANGKNPELGGCKKMDIGSNRKDWLGQARQSWADILNQNLPADAQVSHLSNAELGLPEPQPKFGAKVLAVEKKGIRTELVNRIIEQEIKGESNEQNQPVNTKQSERGGQPISAVGRVESPRRPAHLGYTTIPNRRPNESLERSNQQANGHSAQNSEPTGKAEVDSLDNLGDSRRADICDISASYQPAGKPVQHGLQAGRGGADMQKDLTFLAVQKQLAAMPDVSQFEMGILNQKTGRMMISRASAGQVLEQMSRLKRENARNNNIFIRPDRSINHPYLLLDDLNGSQLKELKRAGFDSALELMTSPNNHQVLVKLPEALSTGARKELERALQKRFNSDPNSCDGQHFFRLAGFTNRKEKHLNDGKFPFVKVVNSNSKPVLSEDARKFLYVGPQLMEVDENKPEKIVQMAGGFPSEVGKKGELSKRVSDSHELLRFRYGQAYDPSKADLQIAKTLLNQGWNIESVESGLLEGSPEIEKRKSGHVDDYLQRTLTAAIGKVASKPSYRKSLPAPESSADDDVKFAMRF